jgi:hypothetical protein
MSTVKCISLWQPWATLWMAGAKLNETRAWATSHRGDVIVHAAKEWNRKLRGLCFEEPFISALSMLRPNQGGAFHFGDALDMILPRGCLLGVVELVGSVRITAANAPIGNERAFGDYTPGRFMWQAINRRPLPEPIPYAGSQGFFGVPASVLGMGPRPVITQPQKDCLFT